MKIKYTYTSTIKDRTLQGEAYLISGSHSIPLSDKRREPCPSVEWFAPTPMEYPVQDEYIGSYENYVKATTERWNERVIPGLTTYIMEWPEYPITYTQFSSSLEES